MCVCVCVCVYTHTHTQTSPHPPTHLHTHVYICAYHDTVTTLSSRSGMPVIAHRCELGRVSGLVYLLFFV
jgi:hypothetical protein